MVLIVETPSGVTPASSKIPSVLFLIS